MSLPQKKQSERVSTSLTSLLALADQGGRLGLDKGRRRAAQSGLYLSRFKGRGMEFDEARPYQAGDDVRSIDWRVTARTGRTHTKTFREEREQPVFISVDYRPSMVFATRGVFKSVQAARLAALLAWSAKSRGDRVGGQIFSDHGCLELKPGHGKHAVLRFLNALVMPGYTLKQPVGLSLALNRLVQHARPGSRVFVISDFRGLDDDAQQHLSRLSRHCEVVLIQVYDPLESHLPPRGLYRFSDGDKQCMVDTSDQKRVRAYQQHFLDLQQALQQLSQRLRLSLLSCRSCDHAADTFRPSGIKRV